MEKVGKIKKLKGVCPECENKFIATSSDFVMTRNVRWGTLDPMVQCPYCKTFLYKKSGAFGRVIWCEPYWGFEIVREM